VQCSRLLIVVAVFTMFAGLAAAQQADSTIDQITDDGTVVLEDGTAWDTTDPAPETWNEGDSVIVTYNDIMVNTDDHTAVDVTEGDVPDVPEPDADDKADDPE
jgi:hypothetical protein